jgi:hypothetical protein
MLFLPVMLFIRGKTSNRSLTESAERISTEIGSLKAQIPWRKVKVILKTNRYVLVSRANGNAFFIPSRAFPGPEQKQRLSRKLNAGLVQARPFRLIRVSGRSPDK